MIKVVLIDIDDTLLSFTDYVRDAMRDGFAHFGIGVYREDMMPVATSINGKLWRQIERGELTFEDLQKIRWNMIFGALGIDFDGLVFERYFRDYLYDSAIPVDGAMDMLEYLYPRYALYAASNGPYDQQVNRLKTAGMYPYFRDFFISEKAGAQKPSEEFFDYCFRILRESGFDSLEPQETMIIGDSLTSDMAGGRTYGMKTCLFWRGEGPAPEESGADHVVRDLREISKFL